MADPTPSSCPRCGSPLAEGAASGLCPRCLLAMNLRTRTMPTGEPAPSAPPPSPAELEEKFPQFEVLECLGRGGMGVVYKARQKALDRTVAIKILAGEWQDEPGFAERFEKEAKLLAKLNHPHIVTIHDLGKAGEFYYIVMEYVDGVNARDLLRDGRLDAEQALAIVPPICDALQFAHDHGVVHRDIKPENILLVRDGRVKIADFGIATIAGEAADRSGTPAYMAPEQARHEETIDHRADIYALGVVLYEMLTGERPGKGIEVPSRRVQVDVKIDEIVLRALESRPEQRYQTAGEFKTMVETVASAPPPAPAAFPAVAPEPAVIPDLRARDGRFAWIALLLTFVGTPFLVGMVSPRQEGAVLLLGICFAIASMVFAIRARRSRTGRTVLAIWCSMIVIAVLLVGIYMVRSRSHLAMEAARLRSQELDIEATRDFEERIDRAARSTRMEAGAEPRIRIFLDDGDKISINGVGFSAAEQEYVLQRLMDRERRLPVRITSSQKFDYPGLLSILKSCEVIGVHGITFWNSGDGVESRLLPAVHVEIAPDGGVTLEGQTMTKEALPNAMKKLAAENPMVPLRISAVGPAPRPARTFSVMWLAAEYFERISYTTESGIAERWQKEAAQAALVRIHIGGDGSASLGGRVLEPELLLDQLRKLSAEKPERPVMIEAHAFAPYSAVTAVLDLCTRASLPNVSFFTMTTPDEEEVPLPKAEPDPGVELILPEGRDFDR